MARRTGLLAPVRAMGQQRFAVHEERDNVRKEAAQLVKDGEAVGVDIAPIVQATLMQPGGACQCLPTVAGAEDNDGPRHPWEGEEVGLVFGDEDKLDGQGKRRKASQVERDVSQARAARHAGQGRVEQAQAHPHRLVQKAETTGELRGAARAGVNGLRRQGQVQKLGQHTPVTLDELAVYTRRVYLAQVDPRPRMTL